MDDSRWERVAASTGLVFVALLVISSVMVPAPPKADAAIEKITSYVTDHRSAILFADWLGALAVLFALWFLGSLRSYLRQIEGGNGRLSAVAFGGGLVAGGIALAGSAIGNALALHAAGSGSPDVVRALFDLSGALLLLIWIPVAGWVGATSVVAMRSDALPKWYGWAGAVLTLYLVVASIGASQDSGPLAQGGALGLVAFIMFGLWVIATSILLMQKIGAAAK